MLLDERLKQFVSEHEYDNVHDLALKASLYKNIDIQSAVQQIKGRQIAKNKIPSWYNNPNIIYPKHLSMEQCSSEHTALFKSQLCAGNSIVDLTGGLGVDIAFISKQFASISYVEEQSELCDIAKCNFETLGLNIKVINALSEDYLKTMDPVDLIYIDPARRDNVGRKTVRIEDCTPNIVEIEELLENKSSKTIIKLSPMLDISLAIKTLRSISDVYIISLNNECKELLFIKNNVDKIHTEPALHCVDIRSNKIDLFTFTKAREDNMVVSYTTRPEKYLYEPNSSILKAGAYKSVAEKFGLFKLHPNSHLYTSDKLINPFPGRIFKIDNTCSPDKKDLRKENGGIKQGNISTRNFPMSSQELAKKLKVTDGGDTYMFGTTLADDKKVLIICHKV